MYNSSHTLHNILVPYRTQLLACYSCPNVLFKIGNQTPLRAKNDPLLGFKPSTRLAEKTTLVNFEPSILPRENKHPLVGSKPSTLRLTILKRSTVESSHLQGKTPRI